MRRRPDLIVPIRDRRQRKRIVTLRNARNLAIVLLVAFIAITIHSEKSDPGPGEYGRLYSKELPPPVEQAPVEVVHEGAVVDDRTHADPMLVQPMVRAQWLDADDQAAIERSGTAPAQQPPSMEGDITIVGGPEGVTVVRTERRRPLLSGGFGR